MITYNIGFINSKGLEDETQLDVEEYNREDQEIIELINLLLDLKEEMDIKEVTYIECIDDGEEE